VRGASKVLVIVALASAAACNRQAPQQNHDVAITNGAAGADVEALPADESSGTPSNQLVNGNDNPDVNDATGNAD
jgi:hypothetical protein